MNSRKILLTANSSWNIVNFRMPLVRHLQAQGWQVYAAAPQDEHSQRLSGLVEGYIPLPMQSSGTSPIEDYKLLQRYKYCFRTVNPDLICSYTIKPNIYGSIAAGSLGIPIINNVSGLGTAFLSRGWLTQLVKILYRYAFAKSAHVFFQNEADRSLFVDEGLVGAKKTGLLPGSGVNLQHFSPSEQNSNTVQEKVRFILVARMLWDKGVGEFVEAARKVKQKHTQVECCLVGPVGVDNRTAITKEQIEQWQQEDIIEYQGSSPDIRRDMQLCDCVVLPSYREGLSRVLLEAAAMGKPVIATNVPGCREVVDEGENGFLCRVKDAEDLAVQMLRFIDLPLPDKVKMGKASRRKAEREFDEQKVVDAYMEQIRRSTR